VSFFAPLTFHDALLRYQQEVTLYKARGTQLLERPQYTYWDGKFGHLPLKQITGQVVNKYITELMAQHKTSTVKRYFCTINHIFNMCVEWDLLPTNPLAKLKRVKIRDKRIRFLSAYERHILLQAAKEDRNPCIYPYIVLCLDVGLRREECRTLRWCDFHAGGQTITIWKRKNNKPLTLPISDFAYGVLMDYHEKLGEDPKYVENHSRDDFVFKSRNGIPAFIRSAWYRLMKKTGLGKTGVHIHTMRHSAASDLLANGASLMHVKEILGHSDVSTTAIYGHLERNNLRDVIQQASYKFNV
jgi:site-specific recombinase XerD